MKLPIRSVASLLALAALLAGVPALAADAKSDPRPTIVILGDVNSVPFQTGPAWPTIMQKAHPDWNVANLSEAKRTTPDLVEKIDDLLQPLEHVEVVAIFMGTNDAAAAAYAKTPADKLGEHMSSLLKKLQANPKTAKAQLVVFTPMPVIDARLDQYGKEPYKDGEAHSDALASAFAKAAQDAGVTVNDFHTWAKDDKDDAGKPGKLLGSLGFRIRDWGHPTVARYMDDALTKLKPLPPDPAAFAAWQAEQAGFAKLGEILHSTSEGVVAHSDSPFEATLAGEKVTVQIPASALAGKTLDLLFTAKDGKLSGIGHGANLTVYKTLLNVSTETGEVAIPLAATNWQLLDEALPNKAIEPDKYRFNRGKMNTFGIVSDEPGQRRWMLARFDLAPLQGKTVKSAKLDFVQPPADYTEIFLGSKVVGTIKGAFGVPATYLVAGADLAWDPDDATWATRDGKIGWTGGKIDSAKRKAALEAFLKENPPKAVAARAQEELAKLK